MRQCHAVWCVLTCLCCGLQCAAGTFSATTGATSSNTCTSVSFVVCQSLFALLVVLTHFLSVCLALSDCALSLFFSPFLSLYVSSPLSQTRPICFCSRSTPSTFPLHPSFSLSVSFFPSGSLPLLFLQFLFPMPLCFLFLSLSLYAGAQNQISGHIMFVVCIYMYR